MTRSLDAITTAIEDNPRFDALARVASNAVAPLGRGRARDLLSGRQIGHALHPMLTDLPIGFWTTSFVLDIVGGPDARDVSRRCIAFGLATVPLTGMAGWSDWTVASDRSSPGADPAGVRRVGIVHATLNGSATLAYAASWLARRQGKQATGVAWGMIGATAATAAGHLGGHLVLRLGAGVDHVAPPVAASSDVGA